jgi:hypothetical protein
MPALPKFLSLLGRDSQYKAEEVSIASNDSDNGAFITILGSVGAWVGSSTVQHMTGLSLTRPVLAIFGPVGFVGAFGIFQVGLKAAMNSAQLNAFGWSADQSPAKGVREALTVGVSEGDEINFGLDLDRQQVYISPLSSEKRTKGTRKVMQGKWDSSGSFSMEKNPDEGNAHITSIVGASGRTNNIYINSKSIVDTSTFHTNVSWLGRRKGCFVTCDDEDTLSWDLWTYFLVVVILCTVFVSSVIVTEIFMITGATSVSEIQVIMYGVTKLLTIVLLHLKFVLVALPRMPGKKCTARCVPARIRIYRQRCAQSGGENGTAFVYCERSYRIIQGIDHPSRENTNQDGKGKERHSYFYHGEKKGTDTKSVKSHQCIVQIVEVLAATCGLLFLFFYAWYVAWLTDNARQIKNSSYKLYIWSAIEYIFLAAKIALMATDLNWKGISHGQEVELELHIDGTPKHLHFTDQELRYGALVEASGKHVIKAHAQMHTFLQSKLCAVHLNKSDKLPSISCFHLYQPEFSKGTSVVVLANTERGVFRRLLVNPRGGDKHNHFAVRTKNGRLQLGVVEWEDDNIKLPERKSTKKGVVIEEIRAFSITAVEHLLATGKKVTAVAMRTEHSDLRDLKWHTFRRTTAEYTFGSRNKLYRMEGIEEAKLTRALLTNRGVYNQPLVDGHGMCEKKCI